MYIIEAKKREEIKTNTWSRKQERSEDKMSVVDDIIAVDRTYEHGGEGIDTGLLIRHTQVHSSIVYISYIGYCLIMLHVLC